jgi:hypothetical protein
MSIKQLHPNLSSPQPLATPNLSLWIHLFWMSHKWSFKVCNPCVWMLSLSIMFVEVHPYPHMCDMCQYFTPFNE